MTKNILFIEELVKGWKLYGKTGSGSLLNEDKTQKLDLQIGWFIGWIQKDNRTIIFANFIQDQDKQDTYASFRARAAAKEKLKQLIARE
jgi:beta-lactamase class D